MMKFKIDENLPIEVADMLADAQFDATTVYIEQLIGTSDLNLLDHCQRDDRVLVSLDLDFADIRAYPPDNYPGMIVLRLKRQDKDYVLNILRRLVGVLTTETLRGKLWIVEENRIRVRG